jgi:hypothetical protein
MMQAPIGSSGSGSVDAAAIALDNEHVEKRGSPDAQSAAAQSPDGVRRCSRWHPPIRREGLSELFTLPTGEDGPRVVLEVRYSQFVAVAPLD